MTNPHDMFQELLKNFGSGHGFGGMSIDEMYNSCVVQAMEKMHDAWGREIKRLKRPRYNPFDVLGISVSAPEEEVKRAYREKAKEHHPDKGGDKEQFIRLQLAYEMIKKLKGWN